MLHATSVRIRENNDMNSLEKTAIASAKLKYGGLTDRLSSAERRRAARRRSLKRFGLSDGIRVVLIRNAFDEEKNGYYVEVQGPDSSTCP